MKKLILGIAWQIMGFLGSIIIFCSAVLHDGNCNGFTDILDNLFGLCLIVPLFICIVLLVIGMVLSFAGMQEK